MTRKIYEDNVYKVEHEAVIENIINDGHIAVVLNETIFFPVGGGQSADRGTIDGIEVLNVIEKDGEIYHIIESMPKNNKVILKIDWDRRFDQMQQHCGEHILSGIIKSKHNWDNKGFHLGDDFVSIDIDINNITKEIIDDIEDLANDAIHRNIELKITTLEDANQVVDFPVRKELTVVGDIRVVMIPGVDCVACCGTHPARTGDVGLIKIYKTEKNKKMTRIFFKCGKRALGDLRKKTDLVQKLNQMYSSDDDTLLELIRLEKEKNENLKKKYIKLKREQIDKQIAAKLKVEYNIVDMIFDDLSSSEMNYVIKKISENRNAVILLYSKSENKIMLSHDGSRNIDCGQIFKSIKLSGGKGGGSSKVAQGVFNNEQDGLIFFKVVMSQIIGAADD